MNFKIASLRKTYHVSFLFFIYLFDSSRLWMVRHTPILFFFRAMIFISLVFNTSLKPVNYPIISCFIFPANEARTSMNLAERWRRNDWKMPQESTDRQRQREEIKKKRKKENAREITGGRKGWFPRLVSEVRFSSVRVAMP